MENNNLHSFLSDDDMDYSVPYQESDFHAVALRLDVRDKRLTLFSWLKWGTFAFACALIGAATMYVLLDSKIENLNQAIGQLKNAPIQYKHDTVVEKQLVFKHDTIYLKIFEQNTSIPMYSKQGNIEPVLTTLPNSTTIQTTNDVRSDFTNNTKSPKNDLPKTDSFLKNKAKTEESETNNVLQLKDKNADFGFLPTLKTQFLHSVNVKDTASLTVFQFKNSIIPVQTNHPFHISIGVKYGFVYLIDPSVIEQKNKAWGGYLESPIGKRFNIYGQADYFELNYKATQIKQVLGIPYNESPTIEYKLSKIEAKQKYLRYALGTTYDWVHWRILRAYVGIGLSGLASLKKEKQEYKYKYDKKTSDEKREVGLTTQDNISQPNFNAWQFRLGASFSPIRQTSIRVEGSYYRPRQTVTHFNQHYFEVNSIISFNF